MSMGI